MADTVAGRRIAVLSREWGEPGSEAGFVARSIAGALSRHGPVDILVPGAPAPARPDGAFDVHPVGSGPQPGQWPMRDVGPELDVLPPHVVVLDALDPDVAAVAHSLAPEARSAAFAPGRAPSGHEEGTSAHRLAVSVDPTGGGAGGHRIGLHVAVNPMAAHRRHNALGETGYLLVLTDRDPAAPDVRGEPGGHPVNSSTTGSTAPTPLAAWLAARFASRLVVVVEDGVASVWRSRSLRGQLGVDTRTDLQRFMAHAWAVLDLRPGAYVARECVEAQRFGVPIIVPDATVAADLAAAGGGLWFRDVHELFAAVESLDDPTVHDSLGAHGRAVADDYYGDPGLFVARVGEALTWIQDSAATAATAAGTS
ncbi:MAG: hypothetical protein M0Z95_13155 [Actinomycetota bacterium]|nr:hypothetical protein [Actinomycetota bacterium]